MRSRTMMSDLRKNIRRRFRRPRRRKAGGTNPDLSSKVIADRPATLRRVVQVPKVSPTSDIASPTPVRSKRGFRDRATMRYPKFQRRATTRVTTQLRSRPRQNRFCTPHLSEKHSRNIHRSSSRYATSRT